MADPLSLLRQYHMHKKDIIEKNGMICFGEYCWPKQTKTNYLIYSSSRDGPNKNYYTLECLVYFLRNVHLLHPTYVKQAASFEIPVVQRPDRKDLLAYLCGETSSSASIDKSAPIELPISISQLNKESMHHQQNQLSSMTGLLMDVNDQCLPQANKLVRLNEVEKVRKQFAARLDAPKIKKTLPTDLLTIGQINSNNLTTTLSSSSGSASSLNNLKNAANNNNDSNATTLRDSMSTEQIAALKAKRLAKKRSTIIDADTDLENVQALGLSNTAAADHSVLLQYDSNFTKEIQNKERVWRNRTNILQSSGKNFQKSIFFILQSIKAREDNQLRNRGTSNGVVSNLNHSTSRTSSQMNNGQIIKDANDKISDVIASNNENNQSNNDAINHQNPIHDANINLQQIQQLSNHLQQQQQLTQQQQQQQYNRYDQERFSKNDSALGFSIDTTSTYHGLTLKSVTEGGSGSASAATNSKINSVIPAIQMKNNSLLSNNNKLINNSNINNIINNNNVNNTITTTMTTPKPQKRPSRTPIIIIPATNTSLITMYNAKAILQDLKFLDSKQCDQRRENEILIQRRKQDNTTVPYRIIDNPSKLSSDEWNRVVAVFVQGPTWQFKGWPWNGNPVEIFARIKAFHLKFDEMKLDNNVAKWSVEIIELSRSKRHLDRANLLKFWSLLDQHIAKHKHNVVRY